MAESTPHSEEDVYNVCQNDITDNRDWLKTATDDQKKLLRDYLLNLDRSKRVDFNSARSKIICEGIHDIMKQICQKMKEKDPRFSGNLVPMGSANNRTKIDDLNEFDFVHELTIFNLLCGKGTFGSYLRGHISLDRIAEEFGADANSELCKQFTKKYSDTTSQPSDYSDQASSFENIEQTIELNCLHILHVYCEILSNVLQELELPPGWCHGGLNRPTCSGFRPNGIACLLQFDFIGTSEKTPLRLSVDFVPMIRIPIVRPTEDTDPLDLYLTKLTGVEHCLVSLEKQRVFYSNAEELWLTEYSSDSMPKTLMRLGKYLDVLLKMKSKCPIRQNTEWKIKNGTWKMRNEYIFYLVNIDEFVTYSDLGETVGNNCLVKSYAIKRIVMYMMMASESRGHKWSENDLPDLLICVYRILTDAVHDGNRFYSGVKFVKDKFSVLLGEKLEINEDLKYSIKLETEHPRKNFNLEDTQIVLHRQHVLSEIRCYFSKDDKFLLSGISAVFQLLRCVCEGRYTAVINTYKRVLPKNFLTAYVTKEEYKGWLPNTNI